MTVSFFQTTHPQDEDQASDHLLIDRAGRRLRFVPGDATVRFRSLSDWNRPPEAVETTSTTAWPAAETRSEAREPFLAASAGAVAHRGAVRAGVRGQPRRGARTGGRWPGHHDAPRKKAASLANGARLGWRTTSAQSSRSPSRKRQG